MGLLGNVKGRNFEKERGPLPERGLGERAQKKLERAGEPQNPIRVRCKNQC